MLQVATLELKEERLKDLYMFLYQFHPLLWLIKDVIQYTYKGYQTHE